MQYEVIDADTHINEPPDLWQTRVPAAMRERAPRLVETERGEAWAFEGGRRMPIIELSNVRGLSPLQWMTTGARYRDFPAGSHDAAARMADMDVDLVSAHVLYPTYVMYGSQIYGSDRELQLACVRAYNDWMSELCAANPARLFGLAMLPVTSVDDAIAEARRARDLTGIRGVILTCFPNGSTVSQPELDDPFWSMAEDLALPLTVHVGFHEGSESGADSQAAMTASVSRLAKTVQERLGVRIMPVVSQLLLGGVLARHPKLKLGLAEVGTGWIPFFLEQADDTYLRHRFWTKTHFPELPSTYFQRQCYATFQVDSYGVRNRDLMLDAMMWASDYPHTGSDWPNSRVNISAQLRGVPDPERRKLLVDNVLRFLGISESTN
ncbi:MAG: amidohydrolase [Chloroflexi bacterium]|nr:amidohydrolase [Chloroflexota bacterium]